MASNVSFRQVGCERSGRIFHGPNSDAYSRTSQPSIPGKDDLVLEKTNSIGDGFGNRQPRFNFTIMNSPGPGQYLSLPASQAASPSFSKKGYGTMVSRTRRFNPRQFVSVVPGPGSYESMHKRLPTNLSAIFVQPKLHSKTVKSELPAPGQYNPPEPKPPAGPSAIFKSKTKRVENTVPTYGPAPWYYTPDEKLIRSSSQKLTSAFKKPVNGKRFKINLYDPHAPVKDDAVPGPGYYNPDNSFEHKSLNGSYTHEELDRFGRSVKVKKSKEDSPGPGSYDLPTREEKESKQPVSGAVFMSESQRDLLKGSKVPGPAFYKIPEGLKKKSFHLNPRQLWA